MNEHQDLLSPERVTASVEAGMVTMSEPELTVAINSITASWGEKMVTRLDERAGNSPYSQQSILMLKSSLPLLRGHRFKVAPLGKSYDGSGHYKDRGRWRKVWVARRLAEGEAEDDRTLVCCHQDDPGSTRLGCLRFWFQDIESWRKSESVGRTAVLTAFEKLGL
jgi:hypothetical protein